jgi:hypothetical protein
LVSLQRLVSLIYGAFGTANGVSGLGVLPRTDFASALKGRCLVAGMDQAKPHTTVL